MQDVYCTKTRCDAQARGRCDADCDRVSTCAERRQDRPPADPLDFKKKAFEALGWHPDLAIGLSDSEFKMLLALGRRVAAARRAGRNGR